MAFPDGHYTNVHVYPINGGGGSLSNGTGTSLNGTFSCGQFDKSDLPSTDKKFHYKITAKHDNGKSYESAPMQCWHAGATSDFKDAQ
ncbi:MAG: hypothetical protein J0I77_04200 [Rudaea sp.]|uniref:hypothetical protein n=1 Tax=unclassified Rudaea TaxID=2627037 RepID=UPI0010F5BC65|nr:MULTISPECIES: hypothetical protein [unclassified Rudaea]MBN8884894.1 hypothetical protein [Rudaea sp.]MBR0344660.1 hypothetical protein [Rudaea sp.]